jgi:hypothetical protein
VEDVDIISAFWDSTTCCSLVHELGREQIKTTKALVNIAPRHTSGEEAVGATFTSVEAGMAVIDSQTTSPKIAARGTRKGSEGRKKGQECYPRHLTARVSNGSVREEIEDSDEEFIAMAERDFKRHTRTPKGHFEKVL